MKKSSPLKKFPYNNKSRRSSDEDAHTSSHPRLQTSTQSISSFKDEGGGGEKRKEHDRS